MPSEQIAVRLASDLLAAVDALVAKGRYASRAAAVRESLEATVEAERQQEIGRRIVEGYTRIPQTPEELAGLESQTIAMVEEEPW